MSGLWSSPGMCCVSADATPFLPGGPTTAQQQKTSTWSGWPPQMRLTTAVVTRSRHRTSPLIQKPYRLFEISSHREPSAASGACLNTDKLPRYTVDLAERLSSDITKLSGLDM